MKQSDRLIYDIPQQDDFIRFYEIHSDPQTNLFNPNGPLNLENSEQAFEKFLAHWNDHNFGSWAVKLKGSKKTVGFGGLSYRKYGNEQKLNLGYRFDKDFWGQGYATELALHTITYGFSDLKAEQIFAIVRPKHSASIKVLEKCDMKLFGTLDDVPGQENSLVYLIEK